MKLLPLTLAIIGMTTTGHCEEGYLSAAGSAIGYGWDVTKENAGDLANGLQDAGHVVAVPTKEVSKSVWGYVSDWFTGGSKKINEITGDGVGINADVFTLALREAQRENTKLNILQKEREERQYRLKRTIDESERLKGLSTDYKTDAANFQKNMVATVTDIANVAKKLEGWDEKHQANLKKLLDEHKDLGTLTSKDGEARIGSHVLISMREALTDLEDAIKKSPDSARKLGLDGRMGAMKSLFEGATVRIQEKEGEIANTMAKINKLSSVDEGKVANEEAYLKRMMILGTLNNSVNNLITQSEFSKNRSHLAFSHFSEIENDLKDKKIQAGDVKNAYKKNGVALASQYNNTPIGVYVNNQIAKAMGSVCELVNNQCKEGVNASLFDFLDDSSRTNYKIPTSAPTPNSTEPVLSK